MFDSCVRHSHAGMVSISPMHGPMSELWEGFEMGVLTEGVVSEDGHDSGCLMRCVHQPELFRAAKKRKLRILGALYLFAWLRMLVTIGAGLVLK